MQLHEVVDAATADEPPLAYSTDEIIAAGRRAQRRRRIGFASAGAGGLVAVAVAGALALPLAQPATPGQSAAIDAGASQSAAATWPGAAPFTFTFTAFDAGRFHVQNPIVASTAYQIASVYEDGRTTNDMPVTDDQSDQTNQSDQIKQKALAATRSTDRSLYAYLTLYRPGAFNPSGIRDGTSLTVAGHKAVESTTTDPVSRQLAWEYADDAWAVIDAFTSDPDPSFEDLSALVSGLKPGTPASAELPFTVGYVPSGYTPVEIGTHALPGLNGIAMAREGDYGGATYANPAPAITGLTTPYGGSDGNPVPGGFSIFVTPSSSSNQSAEAGGTHCYQQPGEAFCNVWSADGTVDVQVVSSGQLSASEMTRIGQSVEVADVHNQATWTAATDALRPHIEAGR